MTVQSLLQNMTQKELCHWMAYYKVKNEKYEEDRKTDKKQDVNHDSQESKDGLLANQLLALANQK